MSDHTYNGWTNRETWLVNVWGNPESREDVDYLKEQLEEQYDALGNGILRDMIDLGAINWEELRDACASDDDDTDEDDDDTEEATS